MNLTENEQRLEQLLAGAFGDRPPRLDFRRWQKSHAEAIALLRSRVDTSRHATDLGPWHIRTGAWIMNNKLKFGGVSAAALVAALVVATYWVYGRDGSTARTADRNSPDLVSESSTSVVPHPANEKAPRTTAARRLSLDERVDRADLIIRGTIRAIKDSTQGLTFQYNVTKVLLGKVDTDVITIPPLPNETVEKNNDWVGRDVIVFLRKSIGADGEPAYLLLGVNVCALDESLDDDEAQILDVVAWMKQPSIESRVELNLAIPKGGQYAVSGTREVFPMLETWCLELNYFTLETKPNKARFVLSLCFKTRDVKGAIIEVTLYDRHDREVGQTSHVELVERDGRSQPRSLAGDSRRICLDLPKEAASAARVLLSVKPILEPEQTDSRMKSSPRTENTARVP